MTENEEMPFRLSVDIGVSLAIVVLTYAAVTTLSMLLVGPAGADERSKGITELSGEADITKSSITPQRHWSAPPLTRMNSASKAPSEAMGNGESGFADRPLRISGDAKPDASRRAGNSRTRKNGIELKLRKGELSVDIKAPSEETNNRTRGQMLKEHDQKRNGTRRNKNEKAPHEELVRKEQERAMNQRNAGEKATEGLNWAQENGQSGLEKAFDNQRRAVDAIEALGAQTKPRRVDDSAVDLGESDTLGGLD